MEVIDFFNSYFEGAPFIVWLIWWLVFIFFFFIILQILVLKITRFHLRKREIYHKKQQLFYEELVVAYLVEGFEHNKINETQKNLISKIKSTLHNRKNRKIFLETLIKVKGEISGETIESIDNLFLSLGLTKRAFEKLNNINWHIVALGIRDLHMFNVKEAKEKISGYINHPNSEIRRKAFLYYISVFGFEGLNFLDNLKGPISKWTQIRILESLKNIKFQEIPNPKKWLLSENDYVVLFALELVRVYNLLDNIDCLMALLHHKNKKIRIKTISVLRDFYHLNAKIILKENCSTKDKDEQLQILKFFEVLATPDDENFILAYVKNPVFDIKLLALSILNSINHVKFLEVKKEENDEDSIKIIDFILKN